jgi:hypothetical protein
MRGKEVWRRLARSALQRFGSCLTGAAANALSLNCDEGAGEVPVLAAAGPARRSCAWLVLHVQISGMGSRAGALAGSELAAGMSIRAWGEFMPAATATA